MNESLRVMDCVDQLAAALARAEPEVATQLAEFIWNEK